MHYNKMQFPENAKEIFMKNTISLTNTVILIIALISHYFKQRTNMIIFYQV